MFDAGMFIMDVVRYPSLMLRSAQVTPRTEAPSLCVKPIFSMDTAHSDEYLQLEPKRDFLKEIFDAAEANHPDLVPATYFSTPEWYGALSLSLSISVLHGDEYSFAGIIRIGLVSLLLCLFCAADHIGSNTLSLLAYGKDSWVG